MMRYANQSELVIFVEKVVKASPLAKNFKGVEIDTSDYNDDGEFLRVLIHINDLDNISDDEVDTVISSIEGEIARYDDRFPSVRFSEP